MASQTNQPPLRAAASARSMRELLGPPALLFGENAYDFDRLLVEIRDALAPEDAIEDIWVRDIADLQWELLRLRRFRSAVLTAAGPDALEKLLRGFLRRQPDPALIDGWTRRQSRALKQVEATLKSADLAEDAIAAQSFVSNIEIIAEFERMTFRLESRRNAIIRELDHYRDRRGERRSRRAPEIDDADYREIPAPKSAAE